MSGSVSGGVRTLLRMEGGCVFLAAIMAYAKFGLGWKIFALYFLVPDVAFVGYLAGPVVGAGFYNTTHCYMGAVLALGLGVWFGLPVLVAAGLIWCAHIGFDRALGYGLKYSSGFVHTHLGRIGRAGHGL